MEQIMIFTQTNDVTIMVFYNQEKNQVVLKHNFLPEINEVKIFGDLKNALVDFLAYLLNYAKEIVWINEDVFKIPMDETFWMKDHPRYEKLMKQLEALKG